MHILTREYYYEHTMPYILVKHAAWSSKNADWLARKRGNV